MVKIVSLVPARGGSKRLPRKNIKKLNGRPLIDYAIASSLNSKVDETWVSTEDEEIKKVAIDCGAKVIDRPVELASDTASTESVMLHFAESVDFNIIVLIEATYPLIQTKDIDNSLDKFIKSGVDSLLTLENKKFFLWKLIDEHTTAPINFDPNNRPRYQDFEGVYVEEGGIFITTKKNLLKTKCRINGRIGYYMLDHPSINIDNKIDFKIAEMLLK